MLNVASTAMYAISALIVNFYMICMQKMDVSAKIGCYFSAVSLH